MVRHDQGRNQAGRIPRVFGILDKSIKKICKEFEYVYIGRPTRIRPIRVMEKAAGLKCDTLVFTLGYPKADNTERRLTSKNPKIRIGTGNPEWGAEPGKQYFVITWEA